MAVSALGYVALNVSDIEAWVEQMTSILAMEVVPRAKGDAVDLRIDEMHHRFTLYPSTEDSVAGVGWEVDTLSDMEQLVDDLRAYGVEVRESTEAERDERKVRDLFYFIDPASGMKSEIFYAPESGKSPFSPSRGIDGYKTQGLGLGHIVYVTKDYEESKRFYTEVMGFSVSDYIVWDDKVMDATFFHCNPRHHSLAIMPPFGPFEGGELNHIMLEAKTIDDVGYAYDIVRDKNIPLLFEMGKHTNDHVQSFYMFTPSGFAMELGYGSLLIDNADWKIRSYDSPMLWGHRPPPT
jgi:2,3-dihydroxybiphenyl 1,2-dioxygenase